MIEKSELYVHGVILTRTRNLSSLSHELTEFISLHLF